MDPQHPLYELHRLCEELTSRPLPLPPPIEIPAHRNFGRVADLGLKFPAPPAQSAENT